MLPVACRPVVKRGPLAPDNSRDVSRLELLLASKQGKQVFKPAEHCEESQRINKAIKFAAQWTGVQVPIPCQGKNLMFLLLPAKADMVTSDTH